MKTPSKANGAAAAATPAATPAAKQKQTQEGAAPSAHKSAKKKKVREENSSDAYAGDEQDVNGSEIPPSSVLKSSKKKKHSVAPAAPATADDDHDDIALFHPSTATTPAPTAAAATPAMPAASTHADESDDDDAAGSFTSPSFLHSLLSRQSGELVSVLADLRTKMQEMRRGAVRPLVVQACDATMPTEQGMSFLELKTHLMLQYLQHLVYFVMCKLAPSGCDPHSSAQRFDGCVRRLVYLRSVMEKIRPLEKKLKYQIDKMSKLAAHMSQKQKEAAERGEELDIEQEAAAVAGGGEADDNMADPLSFRPNPAALLAATEDLAAVGADTSALSLGGGSGLASGATGVYRPPRLTATHVDALERSSARRQREQQRAANRARDSLFLQSMREELSERPEERRYEEDFGTGRRRVDPDDEERERFEEANLLRLADTRKDKARKREARRAMQSSGLEELEGEVDVTARDMERIRYRDERDGMMTSDRLEQLAAEATPRKRKQYDSGAAFDDLGESRYAKKRKGPNAKNPYGAKFGKGKGKKGRR